MRNHQISAELNAMNANHNLSRLMYVVVALLLLLTSSSSLPFAYGSSLGFEDSLDKYDNREYSWAVTSGARSAFPMTPFGDPFNLFNLFNVFRGSESKLVDESGNIIPLDRDNQISLEQNTESHNSQINQQLTNEIPSKLKSGNLVGELKDQLAHRDESKISEKKLGSPVILVPGYGGSRLEAKLDKPSVVHYFCDHKQDWTEAWVNVKLLLPYMIDCLIDNLRLEYDHTTNTTRNTAGVEIRVKNATSISSVEYLNDLPLAGFAYFAPIIEQLVGSLNYKRESTVRGAPYDFRKAPNELSEYFENLKETSEQLYQENGLNSVTFICHSMGCNNMLYFLQNIPQNWKKTYVRRLISIAAPWGGSLSALKAAALGDDLGMPYLFSESKLIHVQRSLPSTIFLFPHQEVFPGVPLIRSNVGRTFPRSQLNSTKEVTSFGPEKTYMAHDFKTFFDDINHPDGYRIWLSTKDLLGTLEPPGVEVWCLAGRGLKTLGRLEYSGEFPHSSSMELYDNGDGTVSLQSAKFCTKWTAEQDQPVYYKEFDAGHMDILKSAELLKYIGRILDEDTT